MICQNCEYENLERAKYCARCGAQLEIQCPNCQSLNPHGSLFCIECGSRLKQTIEKSELRKRPPSAERRHLTVMFCDLAGSSPLSEQIDPEDFREVIREYQSACEKVVARYEGHIAQYLGDGILIYFGYPHAHEDDARRAASSGLGIIKTIKQMNKRQERIRGAQLKVRVVIHTGLVVVGEVGAGERLEQLALGETPNIAARIEGIAPSNAVVISNTTYHLIEGFFRCRSLGTHSLKGLTKPITIYQVLQESDAKSRLEVAEVMGLTPLVGREEEIALLLEYWQNVKRGRAHVVLLQGEPGIGKSRLVMALKELISQEPDVYLLECRCSPFYKNSSFYPVIDLFVRVLLCFNREDSPQEKLSKLESFLVLEGFELEEMIQLFASLLSIPISEEYKPLALTPERQKQKTIEALLRIFLGRAEQRPVLFVVEDLHWLDPSTLEFINHLIDQEPTNQILTFLTFRPEFIPQWGIRSHLNPISLGPLPRQQSSAIIEHLTAGKTLPKEVTEHIVQQTDGVPLFVEELTRMLIESGLFREKADCYELSGPIPPLAIPTTLQDSLIARLDRLADVKDVAQLGGTIGREFSYGLIRAVSPLEESILQTHLGKLVSAGLLYQRGVPPQATYQFKHALIRDAAYESLLKSKRQQYHQQIAKALLDHFPEIADTEPELVAQHYTAAGQNEQAIPYWQKAGQQAVERSANVEAVSHFNKGLGLLKALKDTPERTQQEVELQIALGNTLLTTKGYGATEAIDALERARDLCQLVGETPQLFLVLHGLWVIYAGRGEMKTAHELAVQGLDLAERLGDPTLLVEARHAFGVSFFWRGEYTLALPQLEQGITLYDSQPPISHVLPVSRDDPGVICKSYAALLLWLLGYPERAIEIMHTSLVLAEKLSHPYSIAFSQIFASVLHLLRKEIQKALDRAEIGANISEEHGFGLYLAWATGYRGAALTELGKGEEGISQILKAQNFFHSSGLEVMQHYRILLAEGYRKVGMIKEGLDILSKAQAVVDNTGAGLLETELYRTKGELLLLKEAPDVKGAEKAFLRAVDIAQRKKAKSLELRATISLGRLWKRNGKSEEAKNTLSKIHSWFTEGFDTADLREAKALLQELS